MSKPDTHRNSSFLIPLGVTSAATVAALVATFVFLDRMPAQEGDAMSPAAEARPAGAGTMPEGAADEVVEGIEEGAAPQEQQAADTGTQPVQEAQTLSASSDTQPETAEGADIVEAAPADAGNASATETADSDFVVDTDSDRPTPEGENPPSQMNAFPEGRDTVTDLNPAQGEDVVVDTDQGGTPFVPTKSGPEGRDGNALSAQ